MNRPVKFSLLVFFFALCGAAIIATHLARERTPTLAAKELYSIVNQQLLFFRTDDFDSAYRQAASGVQQKFSRSQFELMIRRDFASMTEAHRVEFGTVQAAGGAALVQVFLITPEGAMRGFLYSFTAEGNSWKIDGVQPLGPQPVRHLRGLHI
jgi:Domain of unknown function (DUF4864)